jgi:hypothetical protein
MIVGFDEGGRRKKGFSKKKFQIDLLVLVVVHLSLSLNNTAEWVQS